VQAREKTRKRWRGGHVAAEAVVLRRKNIRATVWAGPVALTHLAATIVTSAERAAAVAAAVAAAANITAAVVTHIVLINSGSGEDRTRNPVQSTHSGFKLISR